MAVEITCDWCGERIDGRYMTLRASGIVANSGMVEEHVDKAYVYHASWHDDQDDDDRSFLGFYRESCIGSAIKLLNGSKDFRVPDAGFEWRLVPRSESVNTIYQPHTYTEPVLGVTPLSELELDPATYKAVTKHGVFTVEHAADARARPDGMLKLLSPKRMMALDAALARRGLLAANSEAEGATVTIRLTDEPTRHLIRLILWNRAVEAIGESFEGDAYGFVEDPPDRIEETRPEAATRVHEFLRLSEALRPLDAAAIGDTLELDPEVGAQVGSLREDIEHGSLWDRPAEERVWFLDLGNAAVALEAQFAAEAVA